MCSSGSKVVREVLVQVCTPKGGAPEGVLKPQENAQVQEPPFHKQLSFYFLASFPSHRKEIFPWEHIKFP